MSTNATTAASRLVGAQAEAMKSAAANPNGAMMGFMGMGMANQAGGGSVQNLFAMGQQQQQQQQQPVAPAADSWKCSCGATNTGKFCMECGKPRPAAGPAKCAKCGWTASDPSQHPRFCPECGSPL